MRMFAAERRIFLSVTIVLMEMPQRVMKAK